MNLTSYSVTGNGERDSVKIRQDWAISSQAAGGAVMLCGDRAEGSTTRRVSANDNLAHECPAAHCVDDIVYSRWETSGPKVKNLGTSVVSRCWARQGRRALNRRRPLSYAGVVGIAPWGEIPQGGCMKFDSKYLEELRGRFFSKIQVSAAGCWIWQASCDDGGYPQIGGNYLGKRWARKAHLLAWENIVGEIPPGYRLINTCKLKCCVNPQHYRIGTTADQTKAALAAQVQPTRENDVRRFMSQIAIHPVTGCWIWQGARQGSGGYGFFWLDQENMGAHRASHVLFKGPIPEGLVIMHSCDDRECVNPAHLTPGTHAENSADMVRKGRSIRGDAHNRAKLTEDHVRAIRAEYIHRYGELKRLANKYNVTGPTIEGIVKGRLWKHLL